MSIPNEVSKWVKAQLSESGFFSKDLKIKVGALTAVPLNEESVKVSHFWSGLYQVLENSGKFSLYLYNGATEKGVFFKSDIDFISCETPKTDIVADQVSIEDIMRNAKKEALNCPKHLKEVDRINDFISAKARKNKNADTGQVEQLQDDEPTKLENVGATETLTSTEPTKAFDGDQAANIEQGMVDKTNIAKAPKKQTEDIIDRATTQQQGVDLNELYERSQVLEDTLCSYAHNFQSITDDDLAMVRVVDLNVEVLDACEHKTYIKRGDILIKYQDNTDAAPVYVVKSGSTSRQFSELYVCDSKIENFKVFGGDLNDKERWVFIGTDFLSANAIHHATKIKTLAVPSDADMGAIYNKIKSIAPNASIAVFRSEHLIMRDNNVEFVRFEGAKKIYNPYMDLNYENWCEYRTKLIEKHGDKGGEQFSKVLRSALQDSMDFLRACAS